MVDQFKKILERIKLDKKSLKLFAVLKMDDIVDKWTILLCADWIERNQNSEFAAYQYFLGLMKELLTDDERASVARVGVFAPSDDHLLMELLKMPSGTEINEDRVVNGNVVHQGFILESNP